MWTQDLALRGAVAARGFNWFISYLDAVVASTALRSSDWVERTRSALLSTATDMESLLALWHPGVPVRYRFVATAEPLAAHQAFVEAGTRCVSSPPPSPNRVSDVRIATPTATGLPRLAGLPARQ